MAKILLLETATGVCSIGLADGFSLLALVEGEKAYQHASQITILIRKALAQAGVSLPELDAVAISSGPGSYTSLRVGASTAKGICYSLDKPLIVVDTLQSLALASQKEIREEALYYPMIDARRMEVYMAGFDAANNQLAPPQASIIDADTFQEELKAGHQIVLSGDGSEKCKAVLPSEGILYSSVICSAAHLVELATIRYEQGRFEDIAYYSPMYIKPPNITRSKKKL
jgi:tRNA threonylcarbamoyladenosine biosynthesis protein TsaB